MPKTSVTTRKRSAKVILDWWFNPKNGKVGKEVQITDTKPNSPTKGKKITITTKGFHSVTSGFNQFAREYWGIKDIPAWWEEQKKAGLCNIKPAKLGPMIYPPSSNTAKTDQLFKEMGIKR